MMPSSGESDMRLEAIVRKVVRDELEPINAFIHGNGKPHMGAVVRMDRLEQDSKIIKDENKQQAMWMRVLGLGVVSAICSAIAKKLGWL